MLTIITQKLEMSCGLHVFGCNWCSPLHCRYKYDVDKNMTVLKMVDAEGKDIGMIRSVSKSQFSRNSSVASILAVK